MGKGSWSSHIHSSIVSRAVLPYIGISVMWIDGGSSSLSKRLQVHWPLSRTLPVHPLFFRVPVLPIRSSFSAYAFSILKEKHTWIASLLIGEILCWRLANFLFFWMKIRPEAFEINERVFMLIFINMILITHSGFAPRPRISQVWQASRQGKCSFKPCMPRNSQFSYQNVYAYSYHYY